MSTKPFKLAIAALGGQGGAVLTGWLMEIAEANAYLVQSTSVPGVAQRTGATLYYLEFFARSALKEGAGTEPVLALMPVAGDVDCVVAAELVEAGRSIARGLVTPERTTLIASSHREYTIGERSAMGSAVANEAELMELARAQARKLILFDMADMAARHDSVISAVLLGAIAGSAVLPFEKGAFEAAIGRSGIAVETNLAAFADAFRAATIAVNPPTASPNLASKELPTRSDRPDLQRLLRSMHELPRLVQPLALAGVRRMLDYQDPAYASLYLGRLARIVGIEACRTRADDPWRLSTATARGLALWMSFEDTIRVADLKTRGSRLSEVRSEVRALPNQIVGGTEYLKPRVAEITGTLPAALGERLQRSARATHWLERFAGGKRVRSTTITGFLTLRMLARLKHWRRGTLRYQVENARIETWLADIERVAQHNYELAIEVARAQRLIKGYGDTHERGWRSFSSLMSQLERLQNRADGAVLLARFQDAALTDEEGSTLARELVALDESASSEATIN
jgi:indolepyruvate ferredoxin oxidoreductase beta subunit